MTRRRLAAVYDPVEPETLRLSGPKKTRTCASQRYPFQWLQGDVCYEYVDETARRKQIRTSSDAAAAFQATFAFQQRNQESLMLLCVDRKNRPLAASLLSVGGRASTPVEIPILFQPVLLSGAQGIFVAHNHPSGDTGPSEGDVAVARRIGDAAELLGVTFYDFLVLTDDGRFFSFVDARLQMRTH